MRVIGDTGASSEMRAAAHLRRGLAYVQKAGQLQQKEDIARAIADLSESIRLVPDNPARNEIHQLRASLHFHSGDYERALQDYTVLIGLDAHSAQAYAYRGYVYAAKGAHDLAIADYTEAIRLDPKIVGSYNQRAWSYLQAGRAAEGLSDANRALELDQNDAAAYGTRALIHQALGHGPQSIADLRKVILLDPSNEGAREELRKMEQAQASAREAEPSPTTRQRFEGSKAQAVASSTELDRQAALEALRKARQAEEDAKRRLAELEAHATQKSGGTAPGATRPEPAAKPMTSASPSPAVGLAPAPASSAQPAASAKSDAPAAAVPSPSPQGGPLSRIEEQALKPKDTFRECETCPEMVVLAPGELQMGSNEGGEDEKPVHKVNIGRMFAVARFETTFAEWDLCVAENGCKYKPDDKGWGRGSRPVISISWEDVTKEYLPWLGRKTGKPYRLLTEAEWEYAARAGAEAKYSWGDELGQGRANCDGCGSTWDNRQTAPVGSFEANAFGLYDMHGNVWEWTADCYNSNYVKASPDGQPTPQAQGCARVRRGGSWYNTAKNLRAAVRASSPAAQRRDIVGFRVARILDAR
jgi:formylglycine-generating enzyme required for sulfatase activity/lipoprotein NlpI